jgi:hypothetical protein
MSPIHTVKTEKPLKLGCSLQWFGDKYAQPKTREQACKILIALRHGHGSAKRSEKGVYMVQFKTFAAVGTLKTKID